MADANAWMRPGEPPLTPPDEDGRCPRCDTPLDATPDRVHCEDCGYADEPDYSLEVD
jgi:hypothetical protein